MNAVEVTKFLIENDIDEVCLDPHLKEKITPEKMQDEEFVNRLRRYSKTNQKLMELGLQPLKLDLIQEDDALSTTTSAVQVKKKEKNIVEEWRDFLLRKIDEWVSSESTAEDRTKASILNLSLRQYFCVKGHHASFMGISIARDVFVKMKRSPEPGSSFAGSKKQKNFCVEEYLRKKLSNIADRKLRFPEEIHFFERNYLSIVLFLKKARQSYDANPCGKGGEPQRAPPSLAVGTGSGSH